MLNAFKHEGFTRIFLKRKKKKEREREREELSQYINYIEGTKLKIPEIGAKLLLFPIILKLSQDQILHYLSNTLFQTHFKSFKLPRRCSSEATLLVCETQLQKASVTVLFISFC